MIVGNSFFVYFVTTCGVIGISLAGQQWISAFVRPGNFNLFMISFLGFQYAFLVAIWEKLSNTGIVKQLIIGSFFGLLITFFSLVIVNTVHFDDGLDRLSNSIKQFGFYTLLVTYGVRSFIVGIWLVIPLSLIGIWFFLFRQLKKSPNE